MEAYIYWFVLGLILLGLELASGTFYMLMMALAATAGGLAAYFGLPEAMHFVVAAVVGVVGTLWLKKSKGAMGKRQIPEPSLDAGHSVKVLAWREDGTARVFYRGAEWDAELESPDAPRDGTLYIREVRGNQLILTHSHKP